jgi:hypothetical protein
MSHSSSGSKRGKGPNISKKKPPLSTLTLLFYPEVGGSTFLRKVGNDLPEYKASRP